MAAEPVAAIATAPGRGGIGVVRVSGAGLQSLAQALLGPAQAARLAPRTALYGPFLDDDGGEIDRGLALWFPAPHSYTGEEVLELQGHGGPVVMQLLLERVLRAGSAQGVRLAEPGEFTLRAFLNDKLDLAQAEAVADLIDASTGQAARSAARSLAGVWSRRRSTSPRRRSTSWSGQTPSVSSRGSATRSAGSWRARAAVRCCATASTSF